MTTDFIQQSKHPLNSKYLYETQLVFAKLVFNFNINFNLEDEKALFPISPAIHPTKVILSLETVTFDLSMY